MNDVYINGHDYAIYVNDEEFETIKSLVERWLIELNATVETIDQMPREMRPYGYEQLGIAISKAQVLNHKLGLVK